MDTKRLEEIENSLGAGDYHREEDVRWIISELRRLQLPEDAEKVIRESNQMRMKCADSVYRPNEDEWSVIVKPLALLAPALARVKELGAENAKLKEAARNLLKVRSETKVTYEDAYHFTFKSGDGREAWNELESLAAFKEVPNDRR